MFLAVFDDAEFIMPTSCLDYKWERVSCSERCNIEVMRKSGSAYVCLGLCFTHQAPSYLAHVNAPHVRACRVAMPGSSGST